MLPRNARAAAHEVKAAEGAPLRDGNHEALWPRGLFGAGGGRGEVALERRRARELAAEDHLFEGKEKFVTRAYKEKQEDLARARAAHDPRNHRRFTATRAPFPRRPLRTTRRYSRLAERASIRRASSPATGARSG